jgi:cation diffusion facilitator CzcD-associated flavoprotein CzcO
VISSQFRGQLIHDDSWRGQDFRGLRVAVIASGEEAARIVPEVARKAMKVKVFLHSPAWILPRPEGPAGTVLRIGTRLPVLGRPTRRLVAGAHLKRAVADSWQRRRLTPDTRFDPPPSATSAWFYRALERDNCTLVTWPVYALARDGVRTAEGIEHLADVIIVGSGIDIVPAARPTSKENIA